MSYTEVIQELLSLTDNIQIYRNDSGFRFKFSVSVSSNPGDVDACGDLYLKFFHAPSIEEAVRQAVDYLKGE
jgi:hypothetical protein